MKHGFSLRIKISIMIVLLLAFALLLNVFLNFFNFEKTYTNMIVSRFLVVAKDLQNTAEYGLSLGLLLPELNNIQEVIHDIINEQKDIVSIQVFSDRGQVIFDTNPEEKNKKVPSKWVEALKKMDKDSISEFSDKDAFVMILPLINTFNIKVGALALGFSKSHIEIPVRRMFLYLFKYFAIFLIGFGAITFMGISFFSRDIIKNFDSMHSFLKDFPGGSSGHFQQSESITDLQKELIVFQGKSIEVLKKIEEASKELKRMDNKGL